MEAQLVSEFVARTGANTSDALSCLSSWGWDLKKALIDYNGKHAMRWWWILRMPNMMSCKWLCDLC